MDLTLNFENSRIRTAGTFECPLFCLKDVCDSLGIKNGRDYIKHLKPSWKRDVVSNDASGHPQTFTFVTEEGLYKVLIRTRKPAAEKFQDWLCEEVIPSIRKTGEFKMNLKREKLQLESDKVQLELSHSNNENLRLTMGVKRLEIEEKKVGNTVLIQQKEKLEVENDQLMNLRAIPLIYMQKEVRHPTRSQYDKVKKFIASLGGKFITWKGRAPYFRSRELFQEAIPRIQRLRFYIPRYEMTDEWKLANNKYCFK